MCLVAPVQPRVYSRLSLCSRQSQPQAIMRVANQMTRAVEMPLQPGGPVRGAVGDLSFVIMY